MKAIDKLLAAGDVCKVDSIACMQHAEIIKAYKRPKEFFKWSSKPKHIQLAFKVAFISICHQFNWDFMQDTLAEHLLEDSENLPEFLAGVTNKEIADWLKHYPKQDRVRAKERARLLNNIGEVLISEYEGNLNKFFEACEQASLEDGSFHKLFDKFEAYSTDPLQKKTNVLTHDLLKEQILVFKDEKYIKPAIDYHIMRLYLRTGRIIPVDKSVYEFLQGAPNPRGALVRSLRKVVAEAEELTAHYAGLSVADVNYIEWQIGRSICFNKNPICKNKDIEVSIADDVKILCNGTCPYIGVCAAFNTDSDFISFEEPVYISKDY